MRFDYGVVREAVVQAHAAGHPETAMHGGVTGEPNSYHVVLALADATTGKRIEDAEVGVQLTGPGHGSFGGGAMPMQPMTVAGDVTWGRYVALPEPGKYRLVFEVSRAGADRRSARAAFVLERPE